MLRITKQADYAIVLLSHFASGAPEAVHTARDLAEAAHLPLPMVSKILKALSRSGLLSSTRGVHGGYRLSRAAVAVSVAEVIGAIDGPIALTECLGHEVGTCALEASCPTRPHWTRINLAVRDALEHLPLSDLVRPTPGVFDHVLAPLEGRGLGRSASSGGGVGSGGDR